MNNLHRRGLAAIATLLVLGITPCQAQHEHSSGEFDVFLSALALKSSNDVKRGEEDSWFNADIVFGLTQHRFRVFGEYFITAEEHDLERFQVGYEFVPETVLWIGRFHQPASAWNTEHHHGRYLQTAITRPSIERWEDEHGVIPQHIVGALFESRQAIGEDGAIQFSTGVGAGPSIGKNQLEPVELLDKTPGRHRLSITARIAYLPEYVGPTSAGLLYGHHQLLVRDAGVAASLQSESANLSIYGAYADWNQDPWRVIAALYHARVEFESPGQRESFVSGYAQVERQLPKRLTAFGRIESSDRMRQSRFVAAFDDRDGDIDLPLRRNALGMRWDYAHRQALSIELSHVVSPTQDSNEVRLQWSAAVP